MRDELTPDPLAAQLGKFTPLAMDHAEIMFQAGRAGVRPDKRWKLAALILALSHLIWLTCLFWRINTLQPSHDPRQTQPYDDVLYDYDAQPAPEQSYIALRNQWLKSGDLGSSQQTNRNDQSQSVPLIAGDLRAVLD